MEQDVVDRFSHDLDALIAPEDRIGIAVSGGPDSLALLLLAAAARPGRIEAATIDHGLRPESRDEAEMVARLCERLGVPHSIQVVGWMATPTTGIQERARHERYRLLGFWAEERRIRAVATGHHADDQAETLLMRLSRGSGVRGLAGMRAKAIAPVTHVRVVRPLLGWRRAELEQVCAVAGVTPVADPSNQDTKYERVRVRQAMSESGWLDPGAVARSAANLAEADAALVWAAKLEWSRGVDERRDLIRYSPEEVPAEIVRRIVTRAIRKLASEGGAELRGPELDRLLQGLAEGETSTLRGVLCRGGTEWRFTKAPPRSA
jgi:tRNA(Ile)-lysidine synthase